MNHAALLRHSVAILDSYDPDTCGVEQHLIAFLNQCKDLEETEETFITEVFSGCVRHSKIMKVVINGFYVIDGKSCLRTDINLYTVLCYLTLYRLDELGMINFRKFIKCQDVNKMYREAWIQQVLPGDNLWEALAVSMLSGDNLQEAWIQQFLSFFLDEGILKTWVKDEWCKIYEHSYVQVQLLSPILRWLPELQELVAQLGDKIANKVQRSRKVKIPTEVQPFNITKIRPRSVPVPEKIATVQKPNVVPKTTYSKPREAKLVKEAKERNRRRAEKQLLEATKSQFQCANLEKSEKTRARLEQIIAMEDSKLQFGKSKARPLPQSVTENIAIKLNAAAILREGALYQKREDKELKKLQLLEAGAKDGSEFQQWQQHMRQKDMDSKLADIERRRLEGKLSHEDAILARQNLIQENRQKVQEMKEEAEKMMRNFVARRLEEEHVLKQMVEDVITGHQNAKEAKVKIQETKRKIAAEVSAESQELLQQALKEAESEMKRKMELIQQIRALESLPRDRTRRVDWTASAGHALLSEMSISELRERISLLRISEQEALENRRDEILENKEAKDRFLMEKLEQISKHRAAEGQAAAVRMEEKKKLQSQKPETKDAKILALEERLEKRREERLKMASATRIIPNKQSAGRTRSMIKEKKKIEENRWKELEKRHEHQAALQSQGVLTNVAGQKLNSFGRARQLSAEPIVS